MPEHWKKISFVTRDHTGIFQAIHAKLIRHQLGRRQGRNASKRPQADAQRNTRLIQPRQRRDPRRVSQPEIKAPETLTSTEHKKNLRPIQPETISGLYKPIRTEKASHRDRYKRTRDRIRHGDKTTIWKARLKVSETVKGF